MSPEREAREALRLALENLRKHNVKSNPAHHMRLVYAVDKARDELEAALARKQYDDPIEWEPMP
jgi:hypothetical protein